LSAKRLEADAWAPPRRFIGFLNNTTPEMLPPAAEQPNDLLSAGIVGLERLDALDRVATSGKGRFTILPKFTA
jgi:hypothetical protein